MMNSFLIRSKNTTDSPGTVVATADGSDNNSKWNIIEFDSFLEKSLKSKVLEYTLKPLTKLGDNWSNTLLALSVKLLKNNQTNEVNPINLNYLSKIQQYSRNKIRKILFSE